MKKFKNTLFACVFMAIAMCIVGCTENQRARQFGGKQTIEIEPNYKLVTCQWKHNDGNEDLWVLVEPMEDGYTPKTKRFIEKSNWGVLEGEITFIESRTN